MKVHHVLIVTNLLTLAVLVYQGLRPATTSSQSVTELSQFERRYQTLPVSGYRDVVGYKPWPDHHWSAQYGDTLKIRKADPFVFIAWEAWMPKPSAPEELYMQPEFLFPNGRNWQDQDTSFDRELWLDRAGKLGVFTARTDTVDMQGKSRKRLSFMPIMRYPDGDSIREFRDTVVVWVIDNE